MSGSNQDLRQAILRTLCYADVFDYPLTIEEIARWLIYSQENSPEYTAVEVKKMIPKLKREIGKAGEYFYLPGRENLVKRRRQTQRAAEAKRKIALKVSTWLKYIPTIRMVAITGALAMRNVTEEDDIDLMIVTRTNSLWTTRFLTIILVSLVAKRRKPDTRKTQEMRDAGNWKNAICLNLFLDEDSLTIPYKKRNLYTAHELVQAAPLWDRGEIYERFIRENSWVRDFLPNVLEDGKNRRTEHYQAGNRSGKGQTRPIAEKKRNIGERFFYRLQTWWMEERKTSELISPNMAFFHPRNTGKYVLQSYRQRLQRFAVSANSQAGKAKL